VILRWVDHALTRPGSPVPEWRGARSRQRISIGHESAFEIGIQHIGLHAPASHPHAALRFVDSMIQAILECATTSAFDEHEPQSRAHTERLIWRRAERAPPGIAHSAAVAGRRLASPID